MERSLQKSIPKPVFKHPVEPEFLVLRNEVAAVVKKLAAQKQKVIWAKVILFPVLYVSTYILLLAKGSDPVIFYISYLLLGFFLILNFLNLIHDAVHGVTFKKHRNWNRAFLYFFDILGANSYIWKVRHIRLHHAFPNILGWDSDLEQSPLVRIFPQSSLKIIQKYQHFYLPFLYPLYLFNWLMVRDFRDFFDKGRTVHRMVNIPKKEYLKLIVFKLIFFTYILVLPKFVLEVSWGQILAGFIVFMLTASFISLIVLLSPHASIESEFPQQDESGVLPHTWFMHQMVCTSDVSNDNLFVRFFMGSFNYHIAHHLFPYVHHSYYPEITRLIENFSSKYHFPYRRQSLKRSLLNHYNLLKRNAVHENIFEETM